MAGGLLHVGRTIGPLGATWKAAQSSGGQVWAVRLRRGHPHGWLDGTVTGSGFEMAALTNV